MEYPTRCSLGRPRVRPGALGARALACAATLAFAAAMAGAARAESVGGATRFDDQFTIARPSLFSNADRVDDTRSLTQQLNATDAQGQGHDYQPVNPVPVSPQLGAATLTLLGLVIAKYRRRVIRWITT